MSEETIRHPKRSRRQRRAAHRRQEIVAAAARVFAEQGYANTPTKAIADAADMAEGTLYNYFESKRDILLAVIQEAQHEADAVLDGAGKVESKADIVALVEHGLSLFVSRIPFTRILLMEAWTDDDILRGYAVERLQTIHQRIKTFISAQIEAGIFRAVDPELATRMALGLFFAPILPAVRGVAPPPSEEDRHVLAETAVDLMLRGIQVSRGEPWGAEGALSQGAIRPATEPAQGLGGEA